MLFFTALAFHILSWKLLWEYLKSHSFSFLYDKLFFIFNTKKIFVHEQFAQQLPLPGGSEEATFNRKL